jgi:hypothetical protein
LWCLSFNYIVSVNYGYIATDERVICEWRIGKDFEGNSCGLILRRYPGICLEGPRKITKDLNHDSSSPGRDLNPVHTKHEMGVCFVVWTLRPFYEIMGTDVLVEDVTTY